MRESAVQPSHPITMSQQTIIRKELLRAAMDPRSVSTVDVREISFAPGQQTGRHLHPCPVVGYIAEGAAVLQIEGREPQSLPMGSAFHEPAGTVIERFDNASQTEPMRFIAYYLLTANEPLIELLP
jgi:quercetin dioxygenase-like cupin family protein